MKILFCHCLCSTYFLWAWKEAKVKLFPWYSPKNLLSSRRMWCTSLAEQRRYVRCHWSAEHAPPSLRRRGGLIGHEGIQLTFLAHDTKPPAQPQHHIRGLFSQGCSSKSLLFCQCWSILQSAHRCRQGCPVCLNNRSQMHTFTQLSGQQLSQRDMVWDVEAKRW